MRKYIIMSLIGLLFCLFGCEDNFEKKIKNTDLRSVFQNPTVGVEYIDSITLDSFLYKNKKKLGNYTNEIRSFYKKRNYKLAWSTRGKFLPQAHSMVDMVNEVPAHGMMPISEPYLQTEFEHLVNTKRPAKKEMKLQRKEMDMLLTSLYFTYANVVWNGKIDHRESGWFIEKPKFREEAALEKLLSFSSANTANETSTSLADLSPLNSEYDKMQEVLDEYIAIQNNGGWPRIEYTGRKALKKGDHSTHIETLKKHLLITKDYTGANIDNYFDEELKVALKNFQKRHGLKETGLLTKNTVDALNVPVDERINQIKVNMERWKWMPESMPSNYIWINIPEYKLHVYENGEFQWDMNVIVGKHGTETSTPIFNDEIKYVVFNPTWRVPDNIVKTEVLPIIKRNKSYLMNNGIDVIQGTDTLDPTSIDWSMVTENDVSQYVFIQKPVASNPLGKIKFMFPNDYDIYLHDTPTKYLFNNSKRSFSHGCIRVEDPEKLASYLLQNEPSWNGMDIQNIINSRKETVLNISNKEPIFIVYFTSWIDANGSINFREDLYNHDKNMEMEFKTLAKN